MSSVYRAQDLLRGDTVALKLLDRHLGGHDEAERFDREVQILAELRHPGIVSYIAHGVFESGQPYLAMEWLEGEDLSQRLRKGPLTPHQSLTLLKHIAEALDVAHRRHIVHRDLKPSNLFLRGGDVEQVTLLDFGIARRSNLSRAVTRTGLILGTPDYMAPEQVRGQRDIGAHADIFSLGCVLFECLTGQPPFVADFMAGVMAKILFEPAPLLRTRNPEMPDFLSRLLLRMLEKDPAARVQDAGSLLEALISLEADVDSLANVHAPRFTPRYASRIPAEQQLVSLLMSAVPKLAARWESGTTATPSASEPAKELQQALSAFGATVEFLADGSIIALLTQRSHMNAIDLAAQAARCALVLRQRFPESLCTLTTGRALLGDRMPIGEAIERSAQLHQIGLANRKAATAGGGENIILDEVTARLLDARFETRLLVPGAFALRGERVSMDETRSLLGRPTPCVGRDRELALFDLLFAECRDDSSARVVLIIAPAGMGKSRLRHEFMRRLESRHEQVQILICRGDSLATGSAYALIGQAVRQVCGILEGEAAAAQQAKLWQHVERRLPKPEVRRIAEFLGELCGIPFTDTDSVQLRAARSDARIMADQMHRAVVDLLRAECAQNPVLLIMEDLHWSDPPTVRLVDMVLRELTEHPLLVLALARPQIETLFPRLWAERRCQALRLEGLSKKASERLVRQVLGTELPQTTVMRIIEQSAGNPLFLEELIRAVMEGKGDEMPETVLAMLQSRLLRLDPAARRLLRAASIYGQTFWRGGLLPLLESEPGTVDVDKWLQGLIESEILEPQRESRVPSDSQFRFRHALLRDAAYSLMTDEHQQLGHRLAAQYLEQLDDSDPFVLAEHFERGKDLPRASSQYLRAAELAHRRGDADTAVAWARRGLGCKPDEIARLGLLVVLCQVHLWRNRWTLAAEFAEEVMELSEPGSPSWAIAATAMLVDARYVRRDRFLSVLDAIRSVEPEIDAMSTMAFALAVGIYVLDSTGEFALAEGCLKRLHDIVEPIAAYNPVARAWMNRAHAHHEAWVREDPWAGLRYSEASQQSFQEANHIRGALDGQVFIGMNAWYQGDAERAERELRATLAMGEDLGLVSSLRTLLFVQILCARGGLDEAEREARALAELPQATDVARGRGLWALGKVLYERGRLQEAEEALRQALARLAEAPLDRAAALAMLARIQLAAGRAAEALANAGEAMHRFEALNSFGFPGARVHLIYAEALNATGDQPAARRTVKQALARIQAQAEKCADPVSRQRFLSQVPTHARLSALAASWEDPAAKKEG